VELKVNLFEPEFKRSVKDQATDQRLTSNGGVILLRGHCRSVFPAAVRAAALKPFHDPKLREAILAAKRSLEQVIDEQTPDQLLRAGFDAEALKKAKSVLVSFRGFIEENKDEISPAASPSSKMIWRKCRSIRSAG
jgi:hypothetical protein